MYDAGRYTALAGSFSLRLPGWRTMPVLQRDDVGSAVSRLQAALVEAGYPVDIDGRCGAGTEQAVLDFQRAAGLQPDGIAGPATQRRLGFT